ncbi:MAG: extracellular solute-binding protein [Chloroflexi bacterium]|nr:extracellular solute-binding protein [Chloroflexota bacterium]
MIRNMFFGLAVIFLGALMACSPKSEPAEKPTISEALPKETRVSVNESWQVEWDKTLAEARKEGTLVIYSARPPTVRDGLSTAFKSKYGVDIEWLPGQNNPLAEKILAERRAGLYLADVWLGSAQTAVTSLKPAGALSPLKPLFMLPEVKHEKAWDKGRFPFMDTEGNYVFTPIGYTNADLTRNTDMVRKEEMQSYSDLLNPKWKGKIMMADPKNAGGFLSWFTVLVAEEFGPILGLDYMRKLAEQEPVIVRDDRVASEWLVRGKYPLALKVGQIPIFEEWRKQGVRVPVEPVFLEVRIMATGGLSICLIDRAPHRNSATVFLNWLLSREGMALYTNLDMKQTRRIDIPAPKEINPNIVYVKQPGNHFEVDTEEFVLKFPKFLKMSEEVFAKVLPK